jgi:hypothetical protein
VFYLWKQNDTTMPMKKGYSKKAMGSTMSKSMKSGSPKRQATNMVMSVSRKAKAAGSRKRGRKTM